MLRINTGYYRGRPRAALCTQSDQLVSAAMAKVTKRSPGQRRRWTGWPGRGGVDGLDGLDGRFPSAATRRCAGAAFAKMEMNVVLRTVLRHTVIETTTAPGKATGQRPGLPARRRRLPRDGGRIVARRRRPATPAESPA